VCVFCCRAPRCVWALSAAWPSSRLSARCPLVLDSAAPVPACSSGAFGFVACCLTGSPAACVTVPSWCCMLPSAVTQHALRAVSRREFCFTSKKNYISTIGQQLQKLCEKYEKRLKMTLIRRGSPVGVPELPQSPVDQGLSPDSSKRE
jgi:hypothetical protein